MKIAANLVDYEEKAALPFQIPKWFYSYPKDVSCLNYKYIQERNFEDLACGRVLYHRSGYPSFPVRLAGEIFMNCLEVMGRLEDKVVLYDPCCGGAYMMTVLGFLCGDHIESIYASDISEDAVNLAAENLNLLNPIGLEYRKLQLGKMYSDYGKKSHFDAITSAERLLKEIKMKNQVINYTVFSADVMNRTALESVDFKADIIFTDVPYGNLVSWSQESPIAVDLLLDTMIHVLKANSVIAIASDKSQKIANPRFKKIRKIAIGKRKIELLRKLDG